MFLTASLELYLGLVSLSISSIYKIAGVDALACLNRLSKLAIFVSAFVLILKLKNGTPASPAIAVANNVFPQPGGP